MSIVLVTAVIIGGSVIFLFPNRTSQWFLALVPHQPGVTLKFRRLAAKWPSQLIFEDFSYEIPGIKLLSPRVVVSVEWMQLLKREIILREVRFEKPVSVVSIEKLNKTSKKSDSSQPVSNWTLFAPRVVVQDGLLNIESPPSPVPAKWQDIQAELSYKSGRLNLHSFQVKIGLNTLTASGHISLLSKEMDLKGAVTGESVARFYISGSTKALHSDFSVVSDGITIAGKASLYEVDRWESNVVFSGLNIDRFVSMVPPEFRPSAGRLQVQGKGVKISEIDSVLKLSASGEQQTRISVKAIVKNGAVRWDGTLSSDGVSGKVNGRYQFDNHNLKTAFSLRVARLSDESKMIRIGTVTVNGSASGIWPDAAWDFKGEIADTEWNDFKSKECSFVLAGRGFAISPIKGSLKINQGGYRNAVFHSANFDVEGTRLRHAVSFDVQFGSYSVSGNGQGSFPKEGSYQLAFLKLTDGSCRVNLSGDFEQGVLKGVYVIANDFDISLLNRWGFTRKKIEGRVDAQIKLNGKIDEIEGTFNGKLKEGKMDGHEVGDTSVVVRFTPKIIVIEELSILSPAGRLTVRGNIPRNVGNWSGDFSAAIHSSDFILDHYLSDVTSVEFAGARMDAALSIQRTSDRFSSSGNLKFRAAQISLLGIGIILNGASIDLKGQGNSLLVNSGAARIGKKGWIRLNGTLDRLGCDLESSIKKMNIKTDLGFSGLVDAELRLKNSWRAPSIEGTVLIRKGNYVPSKIKMKPAAKPATKPADSSPVKSGSAGADFLAMDLIVRFEDNVWYKDGQTSIELRSQLNVKKNTREDARIYGTINVIRGDYVFHGRSFKIEYGELRFHGETPINPALNIRGMYIAEMNKMKIYLLVTGTMRQPQVKLTSNPPLEDADIISVLVTGRPLYELNQNSGVDSKEAAVMVLEGYASEEIRKRLQDKINLDVLRVRMRGLDRADLTVGKAVTEKTFVSYSQPLGSGGEQRINAEYKLTPKWSIEGYTSSVGRYVVDFLFKYGFR